MHLDSGKQTSSADMLEDVMKKKLSEQRDRFELLERKRNKQEDERTKHELAKDDQFMALFAQFVANMKQNPGPSTSRPVAISAGSCNGARYSPENEEHKSD